MTIFDRLRALFNELPVAHRVFIGAVAAAVVAGAFFFLQWVSTPSYTLLYGGLEETEVSAIIDSLESQGIDYTLDGPGTVMVPRSELFAARAMLAGEGLSGSMSVEGYELLDNQGLTVNDFRQRIDFKRAVEGELSRTLMELDGVTSAQVHLVIPEDELFRESEETATASVLIDPARSLSGGEIETIIFVVSSAVQDLPPTAITVADTTGQVLSAPEMAGGASTTTNRNLQQQKQYEGLVAANLQALLDAAYEMPGRASVSVTADLDFDARETETETYDPDSQVAVREQTVNEDYSGTGTPPGGTVGVDGGIDVVDGEDETTYARDEVTREFGVDRTVSRVVAAPGSVERISIAVVMDDGTISGLNAPTADEMERVLSAAAGLDEARGDSIAVTTVAMSELPEESSPLPIDDIVGYTAQVIGAIALLVALFFLYRMASKERDDEISWLPAPAAPQSDAQAALMAATTQNDIAAQQNEVTRGNIDSLAQRQPEEIAAVIRSWLSGAGPGASSQSPAKTGS